MCIQEKLKLRKFFLTVAVQKSVQNLLEKMCIVQPASIY